MILNKFCGAFINDFILSDKKANSFIVAVVLMILGYSFFGGKIISKPSIIYFLFVPQFLCVIIKILESNISRVDRIIYIFKSFMVLNVLYHAYVVTLFFVISYLVSFNNVPTTIYCPVASTSSSVKNSAIYFEFENVMYRLGGVRGKFLDEIMKKEEPEIKIELKNGLFGSKIIHDWQVVD